MRRRRAILSAQFSARNSRRAILSARAPHRYPDFFDGENLVGASLHPVALKPPTKLAYGAHAYGPGVRLLPYMREEEFPENIEQVWEEHFLYLRRVTGRAVVLHLGGPYESSKRDRDWQDWAVRHAAREGISLFYDSLNPASGRGGDAPSDPVVEGADGRDAAPSSAAASGGLLHADWRTPWTDKLHLLAQLPATRVTSLLDLSHGGTARAAPPPPIASPPSVYPDWLRPSPPPSPPPPVPMDAASILLPMAAFAMLVGVGAARAGLLRGRLAGLRACVASSRLLPSPLKRCLGGVFAWLRLADADASVLPTLEEAESAVNGGTALVPRARGKGKARKEEEGSLVPRAKGKGTRRRGFVEDDVGDDDEEPDGSEFLVDAEDEEAPPPSSIVPAKKGRAARKEKEARERQPLTRAPSPPPPAASSSKRSSKAAAAAGNGKSAARADAAAADGGGRRKKESSSSKRPTTKPAFINPLEDMEGGAADRRQERKNRKQQGLDDFGCVSGPLSLPPPKAKRPGYAG